MKRLIYGIINLGVFVLCSYLFIHEVFFEEEKNFLHICRAGIILATYLMAITGMRRKETPLDFTVYEEVYKETLKGAFEEDRIGYHRLLKAITQLNRDKIKKAHKILDKLMKRCNRAKDYSVVYMFKALELDAAMKQAMATAAVGYQLLNDTENAEKYTKMCRVNGGEGYLKVLLRDVLGITVG